MWAATTLYSGKASFNEVIRLLLYKANRSQIKSRLMPRYDIKHEASELYITFLACWRLMDIHGFRIWQTMKICLQQ